MVVNNTSYRGCQGDSENNPQCIYGSGLAQPNMMTSFLLFDQETWTKSSAGEKGQELVVGDCHPLAVTPSLITH